MNLDLFESTLEETASRYRLLSPHSSGIVACSGGRDSVALLVALDRLRTRLHVSFRVICIDHGLRDVREEVAFVGRLCEERGLPFETVAVQVPRGTGSLQGAARDARLDALERVARETKAQWVALGHTATDQSETVLFRLARGSGLRGISGIRPRRGLWIRPLLEVTREDTEAYLRENRIEWMDDPSNGDEQFTRIRIRNRWLPEMERVFPGAVQRLAESALRMQELHRWVEQEIGRALKDSTRHRSRERITCDLTVWKTLPTPLKPLVLQRAVEQLAGTEVSSRHIDALMTLASQPKGSGTIDLPGAQAVRGVYSSPHCSTLVQGLFRHRRGEMAGVGTNPRPRVLRCWAGVSGSGACSSERLG